MILVVTLVLLTSTVVIAGAVAAVDASDDGGTEMTETTETESSIENETDDDGENGAEDEPAEFEVTNLETNSPITAGETVEVTIEVTNTGDESGETDVWFSLDEYRKDEASVALDAGESETVTLTYVSQRNDDGEWTLTAETPDDTTTETFEIRAPDRSQGGESSDVVASPSGGEVVTSSGVFEITDVDTNGPIKANETLSVTVEVANTGDVTTEKRVWFELDGATTNETTVEVRPGDSETVELTYDTEVDDHGLRNITALSPDDEAESTVEIEELVGAFEIVGIETNSPVEVGDTLTISVDVANVGDISDETEVWFQLDHHVMDQRTVEIAHNESETVELRFRNVDESLGEWNHSVATMDDNESFSVTTVEPETETETETAAATETPTETVTEAGTPEETASDGPGFGVAAAVAALLAAALLLGRRRI